MQIIFHSNKYPHGILHSFQETKDAIDSSQDFIRTTQMSLLDTNLLEKGYDITIINDCWYNNDSIIPYESIHIFLYKDKIVCPQTDRQLRMAHNLYKLWRAGEFNKVSVAE